MDNDCTFYTPGYYAGAGSVRNTTAVQLVDADAELIRERESRRKLRRILADIEPHEGKKCEPGSETERAAREAESALQSLGWTSIGVRFHTMSRYGLGWGCRVRLDALRRQIEHADANIETLRSMADSPEYQAAYAALERAAEYAAGSAV